MLRIAHDSFKLEFQFIKNSVEFLILKNLHLSIIVAILAY